MALSGTVGFDGPLAIIPASVVKVSYEVDNHSEATLTEATNEESATKIGAVIFVCGITKYTSHCYRCCFVFPPLERMRPAFASELQSWKLTLLTMICGWLRSVHRISLADES